MPTNEQRRATAKRKLERQLERRAAQERRRRQFTIIGSVVGVLLV
ncbi:MAG TPA: peptidylprolyl isomerase, partial [Mycobacterium sp.]